MALQTKYNVKKLFEIRRMDFRKPGLKTGVKKDIYMKQARDLKNPAAHPNTNSEGYASLAKNGQPSEFYYRFVTECSYGCLVF